MKTMLLLLIACGVGYLLGRYRVYSLQSRGEALVSARLKKEFGEAGYHLMNSVTVQVEDGTTQIDHILIGPTGVFVIEAKHYSGKIYASADAAKWTQFLPGKKSVFQNPLRQNYKHLRAVQAIAGQQAVAAVRGAVVFTGTAEFKDGMPAGVFGMDGLVSFVRGSELVGWDREAQQSLVGRIEWQRMALSRQTDVEHVAALRKRLGLEG